MVTNCADLCTLGFVLVDDLYRQIVAPHDHRPGPRSPFTDSEATNRVRAALLQQVLGHWEPGETDLCVIDYLPVPVVGFHHAQGAHRW